MIFILAYILCLSQMNLKLGIPNFEIEKNLFLTNMFIKTTLYSSLSRQLAMKLITSLTLVSVLSPGLGLADSLHGKTLSVSAVPVLKLNQKYRALYHFNFDA